MVNGVSQQQRSFVESGSKANQKTVVDTKKLLNGNSSARFQVIGNKLKLEAFPPKAKLTLKVPDPRNASESRTLTFINETDEDITARFYFDENGIYSADQINSDGFDLNQADQKAAYEEARQNKHTVKDYLLPQDKSFNEIRHTGSTPGVRGTQEELLKKKEIEKHKKQLKTRLETLKRVHQQMEEKKVPVKTAKAKAVPEKESTKRPVSPPLPEASQDKKRKKERLERSADTPKGSPETAPKPRGLARTVSAQSSPKVKEESLRLERSSTERAKASKAPKARNLNSKSGSGFFGLFSQSSSKKLSSKKISEKKKQPESFEQMVDRIKDEKQTKTSDLNQLFRTLYKKIREDKDLEREHIKELAAIKRAHSQTAILPKGRLLALANKVRSESEPETVKPTPLKPTAERTLAPEQDKPIVLPAASSFKAPEVETPKIETHGFETIALEPIEEPSVFKPAAVVPNIKTQAAPQQPPIEAFISLDDSSEEGYDTPNETPIEAWVSLDDTP